MCVGGVIANDLKGWVRERSTPNIAIYLICGERFNRLIISKKCLPN